MDVRIYPLNNQSLTISFGDRIDPVIHERVRACYQMLLNETNESILELVPTYTNVTVYFNPNLISMANLKNLLIEKVQHLNGEQAKPGKLVKIPVYYNGEDLKRVASYNQLTIEDVITLHSNQSYPVYMIGFLPGFPYLGEMDKRLATPRLKTPRREVKAGSVGIAGEQTGIYPIASPGGWNIIGHTPIELFNLNRDRPFLLEVGDRIKFNPVEFDLYERYMNNREEVSWEWMTDEH